MNEHNIDHILIEDKIKRNRKSKGRFLIHAPQKCSDNIKAVMAPTAGPGLQQPEGQGNDQHEDLMLKLMSAYLDENLVAVRRQIASTTIKTREAARMLELQYCSLSSGSGCSNVQLMTFGQQMYQLTDLAKSLALLVESRQVKLESVTRALTDQRTLAIHHDELMRRQTANSKIKESDSQSSSLDATLLAEKMQEIQMLKQELELVRRTTTRVQTQAQDPPRIIPLEEEEEDARSDTTEDDGNGSDTEEEDTKLPPAIIQKRVGDHPKQKDAARHYHKERDEKTSDHVKMAEMKNEIGRMSHHFRIKLKAQQEEIKTLKMVLHAVTKKTNSKTLRSELKKGQQSQPLKPAARGRR